MRLKTRNYIVLNLSVRSFRLPPCSLISSILFSLHPKALTTCDILPLRFKIVAALQSHFFFVFRLHSPFLCDIPWTTDGVTKRSFFSLHSGVSRSGVQIFLRNPLLLNSPSPMVEAIRFFTGAATSCCYLNISPAIQSFSAMGSPVHTDSCRFSDPDRRFLTFCLLKVCVPKSLDLPLRFAPMRSLAPCQADLPIAYLIQWGFPFITLCQPLVLHSKWLSWKSIFSWTYFSKNPSEGFPWYHPKKQQSCRHPFNIFPSSKIA